MSMVEEEKQVQKHDKDDQEVMVKTYSIKDLKDK